MRSQAGYNLVGKLELKGQRPRGGYKMGMSATEIRSYDYGEGQGLAQRPWIPHICNVSETDVALGRRVSSPAIPKPDSVP